MSDVLPHITDPYHAEKCYMTAELNREHTKA